MGHQWKASSPSECEKVGWNEMCEHLEHPWVPQGALGTMAAPAEVSCPPCPCSLPLAAAARAIPSVWVSFPPQCLALLRDVGLSVLCPHCSSPGAGRAALGSVRGVQGWIPLHPASLAKPAPSQSLGELGAVTSALSLAGSKGQQHSQCQEVQGTHAFPWMCHPGPGRAQEKRLPASSTLTQRLVPPPLFCTTLN